MHLFCSFGISSFLIICFFLFGIINSLKVLLIRINSIFFLCSRLSDALSFLLHNVNRPSQTAQLLNCSWSSKSRWHIHDFSGEVGARWDEVRPEGPKMEAWKAESGMWGTWKGHQLAGLGSNISFLIMIWGQAESQPPEGFSAFYDSSYWRRFRRQLRSVARELIPFWRFEPARVDPS